MKRPVDRYALYWPAVIVWGAGIVCGLAGAAGLLTLSWRAAAVAGGGTLALFALLMLAIDLFGKDPAP